MVATLGTMVDRIADELARGDLNNQIADSIRSAVRHYESERWATNEVAAGTVTASSSVEAVTLPSLLTRLDSVSLLLNSQLLDVDEQHFDTIARWQTGLVFGQPTDFALYGGQMLLYPIPDQNYTLVLSYTVGNSTLTSTACTCGLLQVGEEMIRSRARADIQINFLRDDGMTAEYTLLAQIGLPFYSHRERAAYLRLRQQTNRVMATGRLRPSAW